MAVTGFQAEILKRIARLCMVVGSATLAYQHVEALGSPWLIVFPGVATGACRRGD